jgi:hypothetical protein
MIGGGSVIRIRERGLGADFDIFWEGSWRDIMRFAGARRVSHVEKMRKRREKYT